MKRSAFVASSFVAAVAAPALAADVVPGGSALVEDQAHFDAAGFAARLGRPADLRQVYQNLAFKPGTLSNMKNSLNGLTFGFGYAPDRIALAAANHGPSSSYTFSDYVWAKYRIGEFFKIMDDSGAPVTRNLWLPRTSALDAPTDPNMPASFFQDKSIEALQKRGVVFMTCHTAVEEIAGNLVKGGFASAPAHAVADDILTHLIPGAVVVPSMVATIGVLQQKYNYSYITVQS